jgi:hypothetical protein
MGWVGGKQGVCPDLVSRLGEVIPGKIRTNALALSFENTSQPCPSDYVNIKSSDGNLHSMVLLEPRGASEKSRYERSDCVETTHPQFEQFTTDIEDRT